MKRKLSLLLAMVLAMTMVMGISTTAMAADEFPHPDSLNPCTCDNTLGGNMALVYICATSGTEGYRLYAYDKEGILKNGPGTTNDHAFATGSGEVGKVYHWNATTGKMELCPCNSTTPPDDPTPSDSLTPAHIHSFQWQTITEPTKDADGLEGEVCSCGATRNTQPISAMDYAINKYADQMIKAAKPGQKITLEFGEFNSFPRYMMEKVAARMNDNITFVFKFKQNKKMQTVTIEPGTAIDLQYDWYGPDKMKELYGAE